jgi:hypothetical protein
MSARAWHEAFLGVSALLGEPLEASLRALDEAAVNRAGDLVRGLRSSSRDARARAMAGAITALVVELEAMGLEA